MSDGYRFTLGIWERPAGPAGHGWEVPRGEVMARLREVLRERTVSRLYADPQRRIGTIAVRVAMPAGIDPALRPLFENGARSCPVLNSLDPRIEKTVSFEWR